MFRYADRVLEYTDTSGTGTLSLGGAVPGYKAFGSALASGDACYYLIVNGAEWEFGLGRFTSGSPNTLARRCVIDGSNGSNATSFSAGTKTVAISAPAAALAWPAGTYGDGSDGDLSIPSGTTTLTAPTYYRDLTISGTGVLAPDGFEVVVSEILDLTAAPAGAIERPAGAGTNASGTSGVSGGTAPGFAAGWVLGTTNAGGSGANGGTSTGSNSSAPTSSSPSIGAVTGGAGGAGGAGSSGAGGGGGGGNTNSAGAMRRQWLPDTDRRSSSSFTGAVSGGIGGRGGAGGGGNGSSAGGGGGGGGAGGYPLTIRARVIKVAGAAASAIRARGGSGGNGFSTASSNCGGGGGGGGGSGGWIRIICDYIVGTAGDIVDVRGGNGGNGGNGNGTGVGGAGGGAGGGGYLELYVGGAGPIIVGNVSAVAGGAASGTTGGTGGTAGDGRYDLPSAA